MLDAQLADLELRSLFTGEHDERDAVCEIHAKDGGTDAQDWAEMMLRMYQRWAERRGFEMEIDEVSRGPGGRDPVGHLHHPGPLRLRAAGLGAGHAPAGADLARSTRRPAARPASRR